MVSAGRDPSRAAVAGVVASFFTSFGTRGSQVQILPLRPYLAKFHQSSGTDYGTDTTFGLFEEINVFCLSRRGACVAMQSPFVMFDLVKTG